MGQADSASDGVSAWRNHLVLEGPWFRSRGSLEGTLALSSYPAASWAFPRQTSDVAFGVAEWGLCCLLPVPSLCGRKLSEPCCSPTGDHGLAIGLKKKSKLSSNDLPVSLSASEILLLLVTLCVLLLPGHPFCCSLRRACCWFAALVWPAPAVRPHVAVTCSGGAPFDLRAGASAEAPCPLVISSLQLLSAASRS